MIAIRRLQFVDPVSGLWVAYSREGDEGAPFRFSCDTYSTARAQRLAIEEGVDRVQVLSSNGRTVLEELAREAGDQGCLRPCDPITTLGIVGELPEEDAVPIARDVLNSRRRG